MFLEPTLPVVSKVVLQKITFDTHGRVGSRNAAGGWYDCCVNVIINDSEILGEIQGSEGTNIEINRMYIYMYFKTFKVLYELNLPYGRHAGLQLGQSVRYWDIPWWERC